MRNITVRSLRQIPLEQQGLEVVERKGVGHPDYICDAIMDQISVKLSKEYIDRFGTIMHHNVDKSLLVAGVTKTRFGGGEVEQPMLLIVGDRATFKVGGIRIPVGEITTQTAKDWFRGKLRFVDPDEHVRYQVEIKPGSAELTDIFRRKTKILGANDTSAAVGYAPITRTEMAVLKTESYINSRAFKGKFPWSGEDIKVMGIRKNKELHFTIAMALVDKFIDDEDDYFAKKAEMLEEIERFLKENTEFETIRIDLNTLDVKDRGMDGVYLTVLGTSADGADSGQVGRGNRVNGVIPLNRPISSEAAAGKNPVSHVGKIYNLLTHQIANHVYEEVPGIEEIYIWLVSQIGQPIDQPTIASAQIITKNGISIGELRKNVEEVMDFELQHIDTFCVELASGKTPVY